MRIEKIVKICPLAAFTLAMLFAVCLWGCEAAPQKPSIGVLAYRQGDPYVDLVAGAIREALADTAEVAIVYAGGEQLLQNEQIDALIKKKTSGLVVNLVDPLAAATVVDAIKRAGVPVVFFNREPDLDSIKNYGKARFVGTKAPDAGVMQGELIRELWTRHPEYDRNGDGVCRFVMLQAALDIPEAVARAEYSVKQARAEGVAMRQLGETLLCNWDKTQAYEAMEAFFPHHENSIELIIANNDSMALGAIQALNAYGYNLGGDDRAKFIPVVGVDALPQAVEAIRKGGMSATVVQDGDAMGKTVAAMILNAVNGKDFREGVPYPWDESGIAVRIPYSRYSNEQ